MTWERAPEEFNPAFYAKPEEYVRFRYVQNPLCYEVESARNLGAELSAEGKPVVSVEFEMWGEFGRLRGYRMLAVDGHALQGVGGWGHNGGGGNDPCPLDVAFPK
jgi:hypothetical protein